MYFSFTLLEYYSTLPGMKIGNRYDQKLIEKQKVNTHFIQILELADSYIKITFINMLKKIRKENGKIDKNNG